MPTIRTEPLTVAAFAPFGQVIDTSRPPLGINAGSTQRFHDLARIELAGAGARPLISIFRGQHKSFPIALTVMERHPLGSQAFQPLSNRVFLVSVAPDDNGLPGEPRAFLTAPGQGVNIAMNIWHSPLTALDDISDFLVVDRGDEGDNLVLVNLPEPYTVERAS